MEPVIPCVGEEACSAEAEAGDRLERGDMLKADTDTAGTRAREMKETRCLLLGIVGLNLCKRGESAREGTVEVWCGCVGRGGCQHKQEN